MTTSVVHRDPIAVVAHRRWIRRPQRGLIVLGAMLGLLCVYVLLHSPARSVVAELVHTEAHGCYFCLSGALWTTLVGPLAGLGLIAASLMGAWTVADMIDVEADERWLVFGLTGLGLVSVPAAAVGLLGYWLGVPLLRPPQGALLAGLPGMVIVVTALVRSWRPRLGWQVIRRPSGLVLLVGGLGLLLQLVSVAISLTRPASSGDALSYHAPLAVFLWQEGNLGSFLERGPDIWALAHPGTAELWFGLLRVIGGEPLADIGQWPFVLLGAVAVGVFARRLGLRAGGAMLAGAAYLLVPMVVLQAGVQANDVVGAAVLMGSLALASAPPRVWNWGRLAALGAGLGLTATTKLALLPAVAAVAVFIAAWLVRTNHRWPGRTAVQLGCVTVFFLVIVSPWWARNVVRYGNPVYPAALPILGRGVFIGDLGRVDVAFVPSPLAWPLYPTMEAHDDRSGFGALVIVGLVPGLAFLTVRRARPPLMLYALAGAFMVVAWWIVTLHEPRFLLGVVGLGFGALPWALVALARSQRRWGAVVLGMAAVFSTLVTFDQGLLPIAQQPVDRAAFYDQVWGVDPMANELPQTEGMLLNTGFAPPTVPEYAAYYPLLGPDQTRLVSPIDGPKSTDEVVERMRALGLHYAYVVAAPEHRAQVEAIYAPNAFERVHVSTIVMGQLSGARRHLFRMASPEEATAATSRYLFRLR